MDDLTLLGGLTPIPFPPSPPISLGELDVAEILQERAQEASGEAEGSKAGAAAAMLFGGTLGAALGNFVPDPGDIVYVAGQRWLTAQYKRGKISEGKLWAGEMAVYYLPSFTWWSAVALLTYKT